jgi:hypothetical protein
MKNSFAILMIIIMIVCAAFCFVLLDRNLHPGQVPTSDALFTPTPSPTPTIVLTDEGMLEQMVADRLDMDISEGGRWQRLPPRTKELYDTAKECAITGNNSVKLKGSTPDEAYSVFKIFDGGNYRSPYSGELSLKFALTTQYDLAAVKIKGDAYSVCVVFRGNAQPITRQDANGVYEIIQPEPVISYLW